MLNGGKINVDALVGLEPFMASSGVNFSAVTASIGFDAKAARADARFIPLEVFARLLEVGARETGDDSFGLRYGEYNQRNLVGLIYLLTANSPVLRDAIKARVRYSQLVGSGYQFHFFESNNVGRCFWRFPKELSGRQQFADYAIGFFVERIRYFIGRDWRPDAVAIEHAPPSAIQNFVRILGDNISFGEAPTGFSLDAEALDSPLPNPNGQLLRELERAARNSNSDAETTELLDHVSVVIARRLSQGIPKIDDVGSDLGVSRRTLQRRLDEYSVNFRDLVAGVQNRMARHLLTETELPLMEIAFMLGFTEASSFSRAARAWFGHSPNEFRRLNAKSPEKSDA